jgi:hypothetical protein
LTSLPALFFRALWTRALLSNPVTFVTLASPFQPSFASYLSPATVFRQAPFALARSPSHVHPSHGLSAAVIVSVADRSVAVNVSSRNARSGLRSWFRCVVSLFGAHLRFERPESAR